MAKFEMELPLDLMKQLEELSDNSEKMCEEMTQAGADVVEKSINSGADRVFEDASGLKKCLKKTKAYRTGDGDVGTKVAFYGYYTNKQGKKVPAPLVAMAREFGTSRGEDKRPFVRPAFGKKSQIEKAMLEVQDKYLPKD